MEHACQARLFVSKDHRRDVSVGMCMFRRAKIIFEMFHSMCAHLRCCHVRLCMPHIALNMLTCPVSCWASRWWHVCFQNGCGTASLRWIAQQCRKGLECPSLVFSCRVFGYHPFWQVKCTRDAPLLREGTRVSARKGERPSDRLNNVGEAGHADEEDNYVPSARESRASVATTYCEYHAKEHKLDPENISENVFPVSLASFKAVAALMETRRLQVVWKLRERLKGHTHREGQNWTQQLAQEYSQACRSFGRVLVRFVKVDLSNCCSVCLWWAYYGYFRSDLSKRRFSSLCTLGSL